MTADMGDRYVLLATDSTQKAPATWDGYLGAFASIPDAVQAMNAAHPRYDGFGIEDRQTGDLLVGVRVEDGWDVQPA